MANINADWKNIMALDKVGLIKYDHVIVCERNTYENIVDYLNKLPSKFPPAVSPKGDVFYSFENGFIKISRRQERIFMHNVSSSIKEELERRSGNSSLLEREVYQEQY